MILIVPYVLATFRPASVLDAVRAFLLVAMVFVFVLLHELGHTVVARAFGIRVPAVVLWPLGGAALTEREADKPLGDLLIAAAGPLVNLLMAGLLFGLLFVLSLAGNFGVSVPFSEILSRRSLVFLASTNLILAVTNLLPIYPLDGGRIFRALVTMLFGRRRSNLATFWLSLLLGIGLILGAIALNSPLIGLTAVLLLMGAATLNQPLLMSLLGLYGRVFRRPEAFLRLADFDPALRLIQQRIEADPRNPALYIQHGHIDYILDDWLRALANSDRALALAPDYLPALQLKGAVCYTMGNLAGAWECLERAERLQPAWSINWLNRAILDRDAGRLQEAARDMRRAFELQATDQSATPGLLYLVNSTILYCQGQVEAARADWERVYHLSTRDAQVFSVDRQQIFMKDWAWVTEYFAFLETKMPSSPLIPLMRGEMALRVGRWEQAADDFSRALAEQPDYQDIRYYRGRAYEHLGLTDLAAEDYRQAIQITRRGHVRRQAETRLSLLPDVAQVG